MIDIQSTVNIVSSSGIESMTVQVQGGYPSQSTHATAHGTIDSNTSLPAYGEISISNVVESFGGSSELTHVVSNSRFNSILAYLLTISPYLSSVANTFGVIGTSGTVESFYDRSRFFFESPHESDPNTERDLSAVEPFMLFSKANIFSYNYIANTSSFTTLVTDKGTIFSDSATVTTNAIGNGGFEQGLSNWTNFNSSLNRVSTVTTTDEWPWPKNYLPNGVLPVEGSRMLALSLYYLDKGAIVNDSRFYSSLSSDSLSTFEFSVMTGNVHSRYGLAFDIQFFNEEIKVYEIKYLISSMGDLSGESILDDLDIYPVDVVTLSPAPSPDTWETYSSNLQEDINKVSFSFDKVRFITIAGVSEGDFHNEIVLDDIQVNVDILPEQLKITEDLAHVLTIHPTASGGVSFTISGTEYITAEDESGPEFTQTIPTSGTTNVPENTSVAFHVTDSFSALDTGNVDVWVDGLQVVSASTTVTGTIWPTASRTVISSREIAYEFFRSSVFESGAVVTVSGELADMATVSNQTITEYKFKIIGSGSLGGTISGSEDGDPPVISLVNPQDLETQVSPNTAIVWSVTDLAAGVDPSTVKLYLNGSLKVDGNFNTAQGGVVSIVPNVGKGYDYEFQPFGPFSYGQTITGTIEAYDLASTANLASNTFEFTITPDETLEITNFFLAPSETTLLTSGTLLGVEIVDEVYGVVSGTSYLAVNSTVPSGIQVVYSGAGPNRIIYSVPLEPLVNFREDLEILVHAENLFPGSYPVIKEEEYTLRPGYEVVWPNKTEDAAGGSEITFPFIENVQVLIEAKNFANRFNTGTLFYRFLTENQPVKDLEAYIESNIKIADLSADISSNNPFFEYGKTITVEIEAEDYEGNKLTFSHTFSIESRPS